MKRFRLAVLFVVVVVVSAVAAGSALAAPKVSGVVGQVYVNDNAAAVNSIAGFDRHADGTPPPCLDHRSQREERGRAKASGRKARFSCQPTAAISSPSTRVAAKSRC